jgi:hypothetical protein
MADHQDNQTTNDNNTDEDMKKRSEEMNQRFIDSMKQRQDRMLESTAMQIKSRPDSIHPHLLLRLASVFDEELFHRLVTANEQGKLVEVINKEPRLRAIADKLK